jgi:hypothetical protein
MVADFERFARISGRKNAEKRPIDLSGVLIVQLGVVMI